MKGDAEIIDLLNEILTAELTAINQYFVHAKLCEHWGYPKIASKKREESLGEMRDAEEIIDRILYLDGMPNMQRLGPVRVGEDIVEQHQLDLAIELEAIDRLNRAVAKCRDKGDNGTRMRLEAILKGEEDAANWLETQLHVIEEIGKERYLAEQLG